MNPFLAIGIGYLVALILVRMGFWGVGGWLAMLADPRHGRLLNFIALVALLLLPLVYFLIGLLTLYVICIRFAQKVTKKS